MKTQDLAVGLTVLAIALALIGFEVATGLMKFAALWKYLFS